jgi:type IV pilus assembly protein PilO
MPILPQNQRDQVKIVVGFVAVALAVVYYLYPYTTAQARIDADAARVEALVRASTNARRAARLGSVDQLRTEADGQRAVLTAMRQLVPTNNEVPALLEEVSTAARRAGLEVGGFTPQPVIRGEQFDTHRYEVTIIGRYHDIGGFLANVGSLPRIVAPVHFQLTPVTATTRRAGPRSRSSQGDGLQAVVTLQTYVERTAPAAPAQRVASARAEGGR